MTINPLLNKLQKVEVKCVTYADDLTVVCIHNNDNGLMNIIDKVIDIVEHWSRKTKIPINYEKSNILPIGFRRLPVINNNRLDIGNMTKILGIKFTNNLKFNEHIKDRIPKAWKFLSKLSNHIPHKYGYFPSNRLTLYKCYIKPYLLFGCEVWEKRTKKRRSIN